MTAPTPDNNDNNNAPKPEDRRSFREVINDTLADPKLKPVHMDVLDAVLGEIVKQISQHIDSMTKKIRKIPAQDLLIYLANNKVKLSFNVPLSVRPDLFSYKPSAVIDLPNYIALHNILRDKDVAVTAVHGLFSAEEMIPGQTPFITIDMMTPYARGRAMNPVFYPDLPAPPQQKRTPRRGGLDF